MPRSPRGRRLGVLTLSLVASAAFAGPAQAALVAAPGDEIAPDYVQDDAGLRLAECVGEAPAPGEEPAGCPAAGAGEHLYYQATTALAVDGGTITWTASLGSADAAADDPATPGDETEDAHADGGVTIQGDGLVAGRTYTITHPYGTSVATAEANSGDFAVALTACDPCATMTDAIAGPIGPFLRPAGVTLGEGDELGDGETATQVVGSPLNQNIVRVQAVGVDQTANTFTLLGVLAEQVAAEHRGLPNAGPSALAFGSRTTGAGAAPSQSVTVSNVGFAPLAVGVPTLSGAAAGDYAITNGCTAPVPAITGTCSIGVTFTPGATGARTATLSIPTNGANGDSSLATGRTHQVALSGTGVAPQPVQQQQPATTAPAPVVQQQQQLSTAPPVVAAVLPGLNRIGVPSRLSLRSAKARGLTLRLGSTNASRVLVRVRRGGRTVYSRTVATGNRVRLKARTLRRSLRRGTYQVQLTPIAASGQRGATITRRLVIGR